MPAALTSVLGSAVFILLTISGVWHGVHMQAFQWALGKQRWPVWARRPLGWGVALVEGAIGLVGLVALVGRSTDGLLVCLVAGALVLAAYGGLQLVLLSRSPGVPCGCSMSEHPAGAVTIARAAVAAAAALVATVGVDAISGLDSQQMALAIAAGGTLAVLAWAMPDALADLSREGVT